MLNDFQSFVTTSKVLFGLPKFRFHGAIDFNGIHDLVKWLYNNPGGQSNSQACRFMSNCQFCSVEVPVLLNNEHALRTEHPANRSQADTWRFTGSRQYLLLFVFVAVWTLMVLRRKAATKQLFCCLQAAATVLAVRCSTLEGKQPCGMGEAAAAS
jgi:hypothetical protein